MPSSDSHVFLLTGNDSSQITLEADKLMLELAGPDPDPFSCDILQESEGTSAQDLIPMLLRSLGAPSFLGGNKIIWLKHFTGFADESDSKSKGSGEGTLKELAKRIQAGLPSDIILVMDGPGCDRRKALAKACDGAGEVRIFNKPDVGKKAGLAEMSSILRRMLNDKQLSITSDGEEALLSALGGDTSCIDSELEKLLCYCGGPGSRIDLDAVELMCSCRAEEQIWALANCLGKRNLEESLGTIDNLVSASKDSDRTARSLIMNAANHFRQALQMRVFMAEHKLKFPRDVQNFLNSNSSKEKSGGKGSIEDMHPYRAMMIAEQAMRYTPAEMIQAIKTLRDALWQTTSSSIKPQIALENALFMILGIH